MQTWILDCWARKENHGVSIHKGPRIPAIFVGGPTVVEHQYFASFSFSFHYLGLFISSPLFASDNLGWGPKQWWGPNILPLPNIRSRSTSLALLRRAGDDSWHCRLMWAYAESAQYFARHKEMGMRQETEWDRGKDLIIVLGANWCVTDAAASAADAQQSASVAVPCRTAAMMATAAFRCANKIKEMKTNDYRPRSVSTAINTQSSRRAWMPRQLTHCWSHWLIKSHAQNSRPGLCYRYFIIDCNKTTKSSKSASNDLGVTFYCATLC